MQTFTEATDDFLDGLAHIGIVDSASKAALENAAVQLDKKFAATLLSEYNKTVRYIKSLAPDSEDVDDDDDLLSPKGA